MDEKSLYDFLIKVQSIAKIGLIYSKDPYAISNYNEINELTLKYLEDLQNVNLDRNNYFKRDIYPTPNISVRTVILNKNNDKVLLVREANTHSYSLPGGWCDLYDSPSEAASKECSQEAGADVKIERLIGILNRTPFKNDGSVPEYVLAFLASLTSPLHEHEYETDEVKWFPVDNLPDKMMKVGKEETYRIVKAALENKTIFD